MKWFILVTVVALLAFGLLAGLMLSGVLGSAGPEQKVGVGLRVDARWISVEAYYSAGDRGTDARDQAWAGGDSSRGAPTMRTVRLMAVPNVIGRARHVVIAARTVADVAFTVARHFLAVSGEAGGANADRR